MRPRWTLSPTKPQHAAGIRIEPPPSLPCATGTIPAATAAADPPEEPPGVRCRSHGLRVGPNRRASLTGRIPYSGNVVVPTTMKPACFSRLETLLSSLAMNCSISEQPSVRRKPLTGTLFLIAIGTPANGRSSPSSPDPPPPAHVLRRRRRTRSAAGLSSSMASRISRRARARTPLPCAPCPRARSRDGTSGRCLALAPPLIAGCVHRETYSRRIHIWVRSQGATVSSEPRKRVP